MGITLYAIPFSTNVERVALALGHKRLAADVVMLDPDDRSQAVDVSGQPLVPVLDVDGAVLVDSSRIIERLEELAPQPPLFPGHPARRAEVQLFVDWFDRVWKGRRTSWTRCWPCRPRTRPRSSCCGQRCVARWTCSSGC